MANYQKGHKVGFTSSGPAGSQSSETFFYGASEAPRVHGITGVKYESNPRFKNQYFVAFKYSNLATLAGIDPAALKGITHRVKSVDAPKFDIETETLNQYNRPRLVPTKINYNPVTITFWDDKSNLTTNFWTQIYNFYFTNGRRTDESQYAIRDNTIITNKLGNGSVRAGYNDYGYYIGNKVESMNLFQYMSLYLVANRVCHRVDLINPYLQSMQHDQFSQEMSSELAQNTVTWGYENVVYYNRTAIQNEAALMGLIGGNPSNIFHWDETQGEYDRGFSGLYAKTATGESTAPEGNNPGDVNYASELTDLAQYEGTGAENYVGLTTANIASTGRAPTANDIDFYPRFGPRGGYRPTMGSSLGNRFKGANIDEVYKALAAKETSYTDKDDFPAIKTYMQQQIDDAIAAANVDDFSDFPADPAKQTGLDKTKTECTSGDPAKGTNNRPTTNRISAEAAAAAISAAHEKAGQAAKVAFLHQSGGVLGQGQTKASWPPDEPPTGR